MFSPMSHDEVVRYVSAVVSDWDPAAVVMDARGLAAAIGPKLRSVGIEPEFLTTPAVAQAAGAVLDDIDSGALSHSGQEVLDRAADAVRLKDLPQGDFVFSGGVEASPMLAAALAHQGVLRFASKPKSAPASPAFQAPQAADDGASGVDLLTVAF